MTKKAILFDLDNTIYSAPSIGDELFAPLLQIIRESGEYKSDFNLIKHDMMRKPFQVLAAAHHFSETLTQQGIQHLQTLTYNKPIEPFPDYIETRKLPVEKFLVTTGFPSLQMSKIKSLGIENDFTEIHIVDIATATKKEVFAAIMEAHLYTPSEVLVVGDDLHSEIEAARNLCIDAVLYDSFNLYPGLTSLPRITHFAQLTKYL